MEELIIKKTEDRTLSECVFWFREKYPHLRKCIWHVPNGGLRSKIEAAKMKAMGVLAGVPDLEFHYRGRSYFFEFKNINGKGVTSEQQKSVHSALEENLFEVWLIKDPDYFKSTIDSIISKPTLEPMRELTRDLFFYRTKVFQYLYSLDGAAVCLIEHLASKETRGQFISTVKDAQDMGLGNAEGFEILFTPDYLGIYRKDFNSSVQVRYNGKDTA